MNRRIFALVVALPLALAGCSAASTPEPAALADAALVARIDSIEGAVQVWHDAETLPEAKAAAEMALNLVVGPDNPLYGDADGDGTVRGLRQDLGLLPGLVYNGIAQAEPVNACVEADILGGSWADPDARWATAQAAYDAWTPTNNTMPTLASHPQRIVGWATLALATDSLDTAHEHAGHAQSHVDVSRAAIDSCSR